MLEATTPTLSLPPSPPPPPATALTAPPADVRRVGAAEVQGASVSSAAAPQRPAAAHNAAAVAATAPAAHLPRALPGCAAAASACAERHPIAARPSVCSCAPDVGRALLLIPTVPPATTGLVPRHVRVVFPAPPHWVPYALLQAVVQLRLACTDAVPVVREQSEALASCRCRCCATASPRRLAPPPGSAHDNIPPRLNDRPGVFVPRVAAVRERNNGRGDSIVVCAQDTQQPRLGALPRSNGRDGQRSAAHDTTQLTPAHGLSA